MHVDKYFIPEDVLYTKEHEWVRIVNPSRAVVGITDYAAKLLTDVVYVSLPKVGEEVVQMKALGTVESIKSVSDLFSPLSGRVLAINNRLDNNPELVNESPYEKGWMVEISPSNLESESRSLLSAADYAELIRRLVKK